MPGLVLQQRTTSAPRIILTNSPAVTATVAKMAGSKQLPWPIAV
jgi:hypothetical protein